MNFIKTGFYSLFALIFLQFEVNAQQVVLTKPYLKEQAPITPNYAKVDHWAALPHRKDAADSIPLRSGLTEAQATAKADVFFIHPTTFTEQPKPDTFEWNADVNDLSLNQKTDYSTILNQATPFNASCRVYAPRYRQAHIFSFYTQDTLSRKASLELAYSDVKAAFEYYLKNYHQNRPIVIASHSQGSAHAKTLIKEFFDGKPLQKYLVFVYLVGDIATGPAQPDEFQYIKPAKTPDEIGGFASWHTYLRDFLPEKYSQNHFNTAVSTNPLTWRLDEEYASKEQNKGGVGLKFKYIPQLSDAQVHKGLLWINKPYVRGRVFLKNKVWHTADINLFWQSIRDNVALRIENFLKQNVK